MTTFQKSLNSFREHNHIYFQHIQSRITRYMVNFKWKISYFDCMVLTHHLGYGFTVFTRHQVFKFKKTELLGVASWLSG